MPRHPWPNISSRQLQAVAALAENRSFIAAAAALKISQPALTRTVKQIERLLGVELFSRTTRQVTVTSAGKEFVALAERLLGDLKIGMDSLRARTGAQRGQVIVSSVLLFSDATVAPLLKRFREEYPMTDLQLREGMLGQVLDDIRSGVSDLGIAYVNNLPEKFVVDQLGVESLHVVLPSRHMLTKKAKIEMSALKDEALISYPTDARTRRLVDSMATSSGFVARHAITVTRASTLRNMVRNGLGVAVVPSSERPRKSDREITSRPLAGAMLSRLGIVRLREREFNAPTAMLYSLMKEWVRTIAPRRLRAARRS